MRLNGFLHPMFGNRTGGFSGSMLSLNPVEQVYNFVLCFSLDNESHFSSVKKNVQAHGNKKSSSGTGSTVA